MITNYIFLIGIALLLLLLVVMAVLCFRLYVKRNLLLTDVAVLKSQCEIAQQRIVVAESSAHDSLQKYNAQLARIAALESANEALQQRLEIQKQDMGNTIEQMRLEFKALAGEALQRNTEMFGLRTEERLSEMLRPFGLDLKEFSKKIEGFYGEESRQRFSLQESIKSLVEANRRISDDAVNLTNALVGTRNNKFQGDWGETVLEQILENSGLIEGEQWERQATLRDTSGGAIANDDTQRCMKPDIIVHFPGKRDIIIDSKVSLNAYMAYLAANDEASRARALKEHVTSVRRHIDELAAKSYDKYNVHSLDYVMLFIPNEPSYFVAMDADNSMWNYAYKKGIVLISPSNLISTLFVVNSLWTRERQQRDVQRIVDTANAVYDKFVGFTENFTRIEGALDKAMDAYRDAYRQIATGKGNITRRLEEIRRQGLLTTNKQIPENFIPDDM